MNKLYFIISHLPILGAFAWDVISSLDVKEIRHFSYKMYEQPETWLLIFNKEVEAKQFISVFSKIADVYFGGDFGTAAEALRDHLERAGLSIPAFLESIEALPTEADRELALDQFVKDVDDGWKTFFVGL